MLVILELENFNINKRSLHWFRNLLNIKILGLSPIGLYALLLVILHGNNNILILQGAVTILSILYVMKPSEQKDLRNIFNIW